MTRAAAVVRAELVVVLQAPPAAFWDIDVAPGAFDGAAPLRLAVIWWVRVGAAAYQA